MDQHDITRIDVAALRTSANRFDTGADMLDVAARIQLGRLVFDGARAGRAYTAEGDALRRGLDRLAGELSQWSRASAEIAMALRVSADRYADAEQQATTRIGW